MRILLHIANFLNTLLYVNAWYRKKKPNRPSMRRKNGRKTYQSLKTWSKFLNGWRTMTMRWNRYPIFLSFFNFIPQSWAECTLEKGNYHDHTTNGTSKPPTSTTVLSPYVFIWEARSELAPAASDLSRTRLGSTMIMFRLDEPLAET